MDLGKPETNSPKLVRRALRHERLRKGQVSRESVDLLKKLLNVNPEARISADQALDHPWFKSVPRLSTHVAVPKTAYSTTATLRGHQTQVSGLRDSMAWSG